MLRPRGRAPRSMSDLALRRVGVKIRVGSRRVGSDHKVLDQPYEACISSLL